MSKKGSLTTRARYAINTVLKPIGVQVSTTVEEQNQALRVRKWQESEKWKRPIYEAGLGLDKERHLKFLDEVCSPLSNELERLPLSVENGSREFYLGNGWFDFVDAEILYCLVRQLNPRNIIEIGSGNSTKLMRKAITVGNQVTRITSIDPKPRVDIIGFADEWIPSPVEDLEPEQITGSLSRNDILFIDSSHLVVSGGDVPFLLLEVLPQLKDGVYVHIHDISLPFDYPPHVVAEGRWGWTEQYLVHAFLYRNADFEIVWPGRYMWEYSNERIKSVLPNIVKDEVPASLWLRKTTSPY